MYKFAPAYALQWFISSILSKFMALHVQFSLSKQMKFIAIYILYATQSKLMHMQRHTLKYKWNINLCAASNGTTGVTFVMRI